MESRTPTTRWIVRVAKPLLIGLALAVYLLRRAGAERTLEVVRSAGSWLPLILAIQVLIVVLDALGLRVLVGEGQGRASLRVWVRATALANACAVFLPAGRAAGEALRATSLAPSIGMARAAGAGARLQACSLLGTGTAAAIAAVVTWIALPTRMLAGLLSLNALVCVVLGVATFALVRSTRLTGWLRRTIERFVTVEPSTPNKPSTRATLQAYGLCLLGRLVQAFQYGIGVAAVGGQLGTKSAFTAQGIELLGSSVGDLIPGQLGAVEGTFTAFAAALGLTDARAISLVVIVRSALVLLALFGLLAVMILPRDEVART